MELPPEKLFVGGLAHQTIESDLRNHFVKFGEITECIIMKEKYTGTGRGFGFVAFKDMYVVEKVLKEAHYIRGKEVGVKLAKPRVKRNQIQQHSNEPIMDNSYKNHVSQLSESKIFVGGLPSNLTLNEFYDYFRKFGTITDKVIMYNKETNRPRGFGFITFVCVRDSEEALKKRFHMLKNKRIEVKRAEPAKDDNRQTCVCNDPGLDFGSFGSYGPYCFLNFASFNFASPPVCDPFYGYNWYPMPPYMHSGFDSLSFNCGSGDTGIFSESGQCISGLDTNSTIGNSKHIFAEENGTYNNGQDVKLGTSKDSCTKENVTISNGKVVKVGALKACCTARNGANNNDRGVKPPTRNCDSVKKDTLENGNMTKIKGGGDNQSVKHKICNMTKIKSGGDDQSVKHKICNMTEIKGCKDDHSVKHKLHKICNMTEIKGGGDDQSVEHQICNMTEIKGCGDDHSVKNKLHKICNMTEIKGSGDDQSVEHQICNMTEIKGCGDDHSVKHKLHKICNMTEIKGGGDESDDQSVEHQICNMTEIKGCGDDHSVKQKICNMTEIKGGGDYHSVKHKICNMTEIKSGGDDQSVKHKICNTTEIKGGGDDHSVKHKISNMSEIKGGDHSVRHRISNMTEIKGGGDDQSVKHEIWVAVHNGCFPKSNKTFENGHIKSLYIRD